MIELELTSYPLDPQARVSHLMKLVLDEMRREGKRTCTVAIRFPETKEPIRFRLTFLGTSRRERRP